METSWIKTWKQNPTTITNGHKTVKMALTKWNVSSVPRYAAHVIRKNNKWEERSWLWRISDQLQSRLVNHLRDRHSYLPYRRSLTPHSLSPLSPYSSTNSIHSTLFSCTHSLHSIPSHWPHSLSTLSLHFLPTPNTFLPLTHVLTDQSTHSYHSITSLSFSTQILYSTLSPITSLTSLSPPLTYSSTHSLHSFTSLSPQSHT